MVLENKRYTLWCHYVKFVPVHYYIYESRNEYALCKIKPTALVNDENLHIAHQKKDVIINNNNKTTNNFQGLNERSQDHAHHFYNIAKMFSKHLDEKTFW